MMTRKQVFSILLLIIIAFLIWFLTTPNKQQKDFSERTKISLRQIGNQLLLAQKDTTSLILPVIKTEDWKYKISFEKELSILPNTLASVVKTNLKQDFYPKNYRISVLHCSNDEVAYSFEINLEEEKTIIPCAGRLLPENCYYIYVNFLEKETNSVLKKGFLYILILLAFLILRNLFFGKKNVELILEKNENQEKTIELGSFYFYPEQNKLVQKTAEIALSKKECELLEIFVANPNQIIKREELTKKVWEDNGFFVGRSLDTYISKLRKKLKEDDSIKLINIHGVGYKLEIK